MNTRKLGSNEISDAQAMVLNFIKNWSDSENVPMPSKELYRRLANADMSVFTARNAIEGLKKNGYIRKASHQSNKVSFVLLRWL